MVHRSQVHSAHTKKHFYESAIRRKETEAVVESSWGPAQMFLQVKCSLRQFVSITKFHISGCNL